MASGTRKLDHQVLKDINAAIKAITIYVDTNNRDDALRAAMRLNKALRRVEHRLVWSHVKKYHQDMVAPLQKALRVFSARDQIEQFAS